MPGMLGIAVWSEEGEESAGVIGDMQMLMVHPTPHDAPPFLLELEKNRNSQRGDSVFLLGDPPHLLHYYIYIYIYISVLPLSKNGRERDRARKKRGMIKAYNIERKPQKRYAPGIV